MKFPLTCADATQNTHFIAGEFNVAEDPFSMIGGGCDNVAGSGAKNTGTCGSGGEGIDGGASVVYGIKDGTGGLISDAVNVGQEGTFAISVSLAAGGCSNLAYGVPGAQVGDLPSIAYATNPPAGLLLVPTGVTTAGQINVQACNVSSSSIKFSNIKSECRHPARSSADILRCL